MTVSLSAADVDNLVSDYLGYAEQIKLYKEYQDRIKGLLQEEMEKRDVGEIVSIEGHVRLITRAASVSFPAIHVLNLAETWEKSGDPIIQTCGALLMTVRQERPASTYVRISKPRKRSIP